MQGLLLHCGAETVPRAMLDSIKLPPATETFYPVAHGDFLDMVIETYVECLPVELDRVDLGLTREGARMFFTANFRNNDEGADWGVTIGGRNSIDKSMGGGLVNGSRVFVCDNLCFSGGSARYVRKHTKNVWADLCRVAKEHAALAWTQFGQMDAELKSFQGVEMTDEGVAAALGVLLDRGVVRSGQLIKALKYWHKPPHKEHDTSDLFAFYQSVNHSLKDAPPERVMQTHTGLHDFALDLLNVEGNAWELPARPKKEKVLA